jgi:hypothetical protein
VAVGRLAGVAAAPPERLPPDAAGAGRGSPGRLSGAISPSTTSWSRSTTSPPPGPSSRRATALPRIDGGVIRGGGPRTGSSRSAMRISSLIAVVDRRRGGLAAPSAAGSPQRVRRAARLGRADRRPRRRRRTPRAVDRGGSRATPGGDILRWRSAVSMSRRPSRVRRSSSSGRWSASARGDRRPPSERRRPAAAAVAERRRRPSRVLAGRNDLLVSVTSGPSRRRVGRPRAWARTSSCSTLALSRSSGSAARTASS